MMKKVELWGDGYQKRELVHVDDFINIMLKLVEIQSNTLINIGSGKDFAIRDFASKICKIVGYEENKICYDTSKYVGAKSKILIVEKLKCILPSSELKSLDEGLKDTANWFAKNKETLLR